MVVALSVEYLTRQHTRTASPDCAEGKAKFREGDLNGAADAFRRALLHDPDDVSAQDLQALVSLVLTQHPDINLNDLLDFYSDTAAHLDDILRSILGLKPELVRASFTEFVQKHPGLNSKQIQFINMLTNHITRNGGVTMEKLYDEPFTRIHSDGMDGVFTNERGPRIASADTELSTTEIRRNHHAMITGELRNRIDKLWEEFWTGGITNPLTVIEQITFLMFCRLLDITETRNEKLAARSKKPVPRMFSDAEQELRWSHFKNLGAEAMLPLVRDRVFRHLRDISLNGAKLGEYLRFIGLRVSYRLLAQAFAETYSLPVRGILGRRRPAIRSYRTSVRSFLPRFAYAETVLHRDDFLPDIPNGSTQIFLDHIARADFQTVWNRYRHKPGIRTHLLAVLIFILPKIGPLSDLAIKIPTEHTQELYVKSMNRSIEAYAELLKQLAAGRESAQIPNLNLDTGEKSRPGVYALMDKTCPRDSR